MSLPVGSEVRLKTELKTEPYGMFFGSHFGPPSNDTKPGLVSVAITLRPAAAEVRVLFCWLHFLLLSENVTMGGNGLDPFIFI